MCVYCNMGDRVFKWDQPWQVPRTDPSYPFIPKPIDWPEKPRVPWPIDRLKEYLELLQAIKSLEDQIGCPCEPNKADYIGMFKQRIADLEKKVAKQGKRARK